MNRRTFTKSLLMAVAVTGSGLRLASAGVKPAQKRDALDSGCAIKVVDITPEQLGMGIEHVAELKFSNAVKVRELYVGDPLRLERN